MTGLYDAKPFTTYRYYSDAKTIQCSNCGDQSHYLMRYRVYMTARFPIMPVSTSYYLVCPECGYHLRLKSKEDIKVYKALAKGRTPIKYNKYSQLDLDGYITDEPMVFGTPKELNRNIQMHLKDMRK